MHKNGKIEEIFKMWILFIFCRILKISKFKFSSLGDLSRFLLSCLGPLVLLLPTFKLYGSPIFWFWASPGEGYSRNASYSLNSISTLNEFPGKMFIFMVYWWETLGIIYKYGLLSTLRGLKPSQCHPPTLKIYCYTVNYFDDNLFIKKNQL
jgi:hypothetical protein